MHSVLLYILIVVSEDFFDDYYNNLACCILQSIEEKWSVVRIAMQRSLSFDNQWEQAVNDINQLVHIHINEPREVDKYKGITVLIVHC